MKKEIIFSFTILIAFLTIQLINAPLMNNPNIPIVRPGINYSLIPTVNNSMFLNGFPSSYFYPASNPSAFISDGNTNWDNIYGFVTSTFNPFNQVLNTTSNVTFNAVNISKNIINSSGIFVPTGKIGIGNGTITRDITVVKNSADGGLSLPSIAIKNTHVSTSAVDFSFAGFFFEGNNSKVQFDMFADGSGFFNSGVGDVYFRVGTNHPLIFGTNSVQRLFIEKDGKVGIGKRASSYALEVNGYTYSSSGFVGDTNGVHYGDSYGEHRGGVYTNYIASEADGTELAEYNGLDWTVTGSQFNTKNVTPQLTNTYSIGTSALRYLKGWFSGLDVTGNLNQTSGNATINMIFGQAWNKSDTGFARVDLVTTDVYVRLNNLSCSATNNGVACINLSGNLTIQVSGIYEINAKAGVTSALAGGDNGMKIFVNEVGQNECYDHEHTSTDPIGFIIAGCQVRLNTGDNVSVRFDDHAGIVSDLIVYNANLNIKRIGN